MKRLVALISAAFIFFTITTPAFAQIDLCPRQGEGQTSPFAGICNADADHIGTVIGTIITLIFIIAIIASFIFLVYGGLRWIVSGGDKGKVEEARNTIIAAVIGLIVTFLAYVILNLVLGLFGLSLSNLYLPSLTGGGSSSPARTCSAGTRPVCPPGRNPDCNESTGTWMCN